MNNPSDKQEDLDEFPADLDFEKLPTGVRGKYVEQFRAGTNVVLLAPDVMKYFPDSDAVNTALRSLLASREATTPHT